MQIAVIGAGFTGVCAALELARAGHSVQVFEQQGSIASQGSFADAGLILPVALASLAKPRGPWWRKLHSATPRTTATDAPARQQALTQLAQDSARMLAELTPSLRLEYQQALGWQLLVRQTRDKQALAPDLALLEAAGIPHQWLDADQARQQEPALNPETPLVGALRLPQVPVINTRQLAQQLRQAAQRAGARFHMETTVSQLSPGQSAHLRWQRASDARATGHGAEADALEGEARFDAVLLCSGTESARLLKQLGLRLPLRTTGGCSLTVPLHLPEALPDPGPVAALTDAQDHVTFTRLGDRLRATALWAEPDAAGQADKDTVTKLYAAMETWFPGAARHGHGMVWQGRRTGLADGAPALGPSGLPGIWLNIGHGDRGTALALGGARALQAMISGQAPTADCDSLSPQRWR